MNFLFVEHAALCMAENCSGTLHNLYTPRGAEVRDGLGWSEYVTEAIAALPRPLRGRVRVPPLAALGGAGRAPPPRDPARPLPLHPRPEHPARQRRAHDGGGRRGARAARLAQRRVRLPRVLRHGEPQREGRVPALPRLVRRQSGPPRSAPAGGGGAALRGLHGRRRRRPRACARVVRSRATTAGSRRWSTTWCSPTRTTARRASFRRTRSSSSGYQAESGPWRSFYLTGALELREGVAPGSTMADAPNLDLLAALTADMVLHVVGVRVHGPRADGRVIELDVVFTDVDESFALTVAHGALSHPRGAARRGTRDCARAAPGLPRAGGRRGHGGRRARGRRDRGRGRSGGARGAALAAGGATWALPDSHSLKSPETAATARLLRVGGRQRWYDNS